MQIALIGSFDESFRCQQGFRYLPSQKKAVRKPVMIEKPVDFYTFRIQEEFTPVNNARPPAF
ncbi:hypothetical protein [Chitinophaga sp. Cy-1792]|uniref:hypothetical protein n=1 Tax=Chitinophaga sp. Cy-1792 TaxID=2608339 RepID=UPI001424072A|nr:hypothetical protein [Chitinophaga sp. Cy-1792]NIG53792.1 hypothetical protein [Chitinophaga sp. Cy-1792]